MPVLLYNNQLEARTNSDQLEASTNNKGLPSAHTTPGGDGPHGVGLQA